MSNKLSYKEINGYKPHKCIDPFNERIGRIKRMRKGESVCNGILRRIHGTSIVIPRNNPDMYEIMMLTQDTRWNRH